jgi:enediyne biosynthesis protein E4
MRLTIGLGFLCIAVSVSFISCDQGEEAEYQWPFELLDSKATGIDFANNIKNTANFNIFLYRNFYNGGGVGVGDFNNDGLQDIYFTRNLGENKLYLNKGNFRFEDITAKAGVASGEKWSTGVSVVDINSDGFLDIYVCNAGYRRDRDQRNELYVNNGDLTFTERAKEYNLDDNGYSTHAAFFDYDKDGDLDAYILNNSFMPVNTLNYSNKRELPAEEWPVKDFLKGGGDRLLRNDNGKYTDVTRPAGIYNSLIGFGLGITVGDVDNDGWEDIYISNDFFERDYLYLNQKDGTFKELIEDRINHMSAFSMGADVGDINNDGNLDIFTTDMLPDNQYRLRTTVSFEPYDVYKLKVDRDFYHQYMQNALQLNLGDGSFSEIGYYSGVAATDWTWGALMMDVNNDSKKDLYVCNGIYNDVTNQDFIDFFANAAILKMALSGKKVEIDEIINRMPSVPLRNKLFMNNGDLTFSDISETEENKASFSNGAAYADLDNDGDLDLAVNNVNQECFILKNTTRDEGLANHYLKVKLKYRAPNLDAIGARVTVYGAEKLIAEQIPFRGFQSSVDYNLFFGLGKETKIDSVVVRWPDLMKTVLTGADIDTVLVVDVNKVKAVPFVPSKGPGNVLVKEEPSPFDSHREDIFADFYNEALVIEMLSREGPQAAVRDINGDGLDDVYFCGGRGQPGRLYVQSAEGFILSAQPQFMIDSVFEDTAADFFDADNDGDADLFVGSGGNYIPAGTRELQDRIYVNDGKGNFSLNAAALPNNGMNTAFVLPLDFDKDGDQDLLVGSRSEPMNYGVAPQSYLYQNDGHGIFRNVINDVAPQLARAGMLTEATMIDVDNDGKEELVVIGEWMAPLIFTVSKTRLEPYKSNLSEYSGWWSAVESKDIDGDGDQDLVLGNRGENFYFTGDKENPVKLWVHDFDNNGTIDKIVTTSRNGKDYSIHLKKELTQQLVQLRKQNITYDEFAAKSMADLFSEDVLNAATVREGNWFKSAFAINEGNGQFKLVAMPGEVQFSSVESILFSDLNGDGNEDILLGGNKSAFLPQYSKLDASYGSVLINAGKGRYDFVRNIESGFKVRGDVTQLKKITINGQDYIMCLLNNEKPRIFRVSKK